MAITKIFRSGNSQAIRIPRGFHFHSGEVEILRRGDEVVLREQPKSLVAAFSLLTGLSSDFFKRGRRQPKVQKRTSLLMRYLLDTNMCIYIAKLGIERGK